MLGTRTSYWYISSTEYEFPISPVIRTHRVTLGGKLGGKIKHTAGVVSAGALISRSTLGGDAGTTSAVGADNVEIVPPPTGLPLYISMAWHGVKSRAMHRTMPDKNREELAGLIGRWSQLSRGHDSALSEMHKPCPCMSWRRMDSITGPTRQRI